MPKTRKEIQDAFRDRKNATGSKKITAWLDAEAIGRLAELQAAYKCSQAETLAMIIKRTRVPTKD